jgi:hypothetical protein
MCQPRRRIEPRLRAHLRAYGYHVDVVPRRQGKKYPLWRAALGLMLFCGLIWVAVVLLIFLGLDVAAEFSQESIRWPYRFY